MEGWITIIFVIVIAGIWLWRSATSPEAQRQADEQAERQKRIRCQHCGEVGGVKTGSARVRVAQKAWQNVPELSCSNCGVTWRP